MSCIESFTLGLASTEGSFWWVIIGGIGIFRRPLALSFGALGRTGAKGRTGGGLGGPLAPDYGVIGRPIVAFGDLPE